jgi:hypothetical protein
MPASKLNYVVVYKNHSQVYGTGTKKIAFDSPPPDGLTEEDKHVFFVTFEPDTDIICLSRAKQESDEQEANKQEKS